MAAHTWQIERTRPYVSTGNRKNIKKWHHRRERQRAKHNPECTPQYNKYKGYEY